MGMKMTKTSSNSLVNSIVKNWIGPYDAAFDSEQTQLTIATANPETVVVGLYLATRTAVFIRNASTGGQNIRFAVATAPSFSAPVKGMLLQPGESWEIYDLKLAILAIADGAGALLDRFIVRSSN